MSSAKKPFSLGHAKSECPLEKSEEVVTESQVRKGRHGNLNCPAVSKAMRQNEVLEGEPRTPAGLCCRHVGCRSLRSRIKKGDREGRTVLDVR